MPDTDTIDAAIASAKTLDRVRKLLAKAEDESVTPQEAEAFTEGAAKLMAKYGIDRAMLADLHPETDRQSDRRIRIDNPWGRVKSHLLCGIAGAMRCTPIILTGAKGAVTVHVFGFESDIERMDVMYTSLLLQMFSAHRHAIMPPWVNSAKAWNRSWLLGFATGAISKLKEAEQAAAGPSETGADTGRRGTAVVLADRSLVIKRAATAAYPETRTSRITYSGSGYASGHTAGREANVGGTGVRGAGNRALR